MWGKAGAPKQNGKMSLIKNVGLMTRSGCFYKAEWRNNVRGFEMFLLAL